MSVSEELRQEYGRFMTPEQVARELGQHPSHVRALLKRGELPGVMIGRRWHVLTEDFAATMGGGHE